MKADVFEELKNVSQTLVREVRNEYINEVSLIFSQLKGYVKKIRLGQINWNDIQNEIITSIDGGLAPFYLASKYPFMIRALAYTKDLTKKVGEKRCFFEPYLIKIGFVSLSDRPEDRVAALRILSELEVAIRTLNSNHFSPTFIQLHGPLVYHMSVYVGINIKQKDVSDIIGEEELRKLITEFTKDDFPSREKVLDALRVDEIPIFLVILKKVQQLWKLCREKNVKLVGVVERGESKEYTIMVLSKVILDLIRENDAKFDIIFQKCLGKSFREVRNELIGIPSDDVRRDEIEKIARTIVEHYGLRDEIVLGELLDYGEMISPYISEEKKKGIQRTYAGWETFIPDVVCSYIRVSDKRLPFRVEFPSFFNENDILRTSSMVLLFSSLLPHYAFPVNLDVVDKMARIPRWLKEVFMSRIRAGLISYMLEDRISELEKRIGRFYLSPAREFEKRPGIF
jgi:hypothetical protein